MLTVIQNIIIIGPLLSMIKIKRFIVMMVHKIKQLIIIKILWMQFGLIVSGIIHTFTFLVQSLLFNGIKGEKSSQV